MRARRYPGPRMALLTTPQFEVLFREGTEFPYTSDLNEKWGEGTYICRACFLPLFRSETKYDSGTGWPSFWDPIQGQLGTKSGVRFGFAQDRVPLRALRGPSGTHLRRRSAADRDALLQQWCCPGVRPGRRVIAGAQDMTRALVLVTVAFALWPWARPGVEAQMMMGGGGNRGAGREAKSERLANVTPEQRAYLEALREESEGATAHRVTLRAGTTRYTSGPSEISESLGEVTYRLQTRALTLRVSGEPLRFTSGDTLSIAGISSLDARLDLAVGARDSLRFVLRAPSTPSGLTGSEVTALSSVGTSTVDLSSIQFGTPAGLEARFTHVQPIGGAVLLSATIGGSYEPRPSENESSYWRGTTMRARVGIARAHGLTRVSGGPGSELQLQ